jgi:prepilin-type N-terminal cleavage/methylation domain-containing protein/prepilin-type processing-associated H-X9-DG protein
MYTISAIRGGRRRNGFSLVEVLVTIAVLSVLIALLLPTAQSARQSAQSIKCVGQLRSWGMSFQLYTADNGGFYPLSWLNNSDHWLNFMAPYVEKSWMSYEPMTFAKRIDNKKAGCPYYAKFKHPANPLFRNFPYAYNAGRFDYPYANPAYHIKGIPEWPAGWDAGVNWDPAGIAQRYNQETNAHKYCATPPTLLYKKQAQCVTMFCGIAACWRYMSFPYAWWFSGGGGADWEVRTGDYLYTDENGISAYDYNAAPLGVHNGKDSYLFMDGHVESLGLNDPNLNRYVYNEIPNVNNPYR